MTDEEFSQYVREMVDEWPALTSDQLDTVSAIFAKIAEADAGHRAGVAV
jgi:hypothetical protein